MATVEERLTVLEQQVAQIPTKAQIQELSDLVTNFRNDLSSIQNSQATAINVLETRVADILGRLLALETA